MKRLLSVGCKLAAVGALASAMGCASIVRLPGDKACPAADGREVVEYVDIQNTSWKLLCFIPLFSGDIREPNEVTACWFEDTASLENQMRMLDDEVKRTGATQAIDVTSREDDDFTFFILLKRYCYHTSATLVK